MDDKTKINVSISSIRKALFKIFGGAAYGEVGDLLIKYLQELERWED